MVRLGILSLGFHLVWRALCWCIKTYQGSASVDAQRQLFSFYDDDEVWFESCFYNHAFRMLSYLYRVTGVNFWELKSKKASMQIRDALFSEANKFWNSFPENTIIKTIHPTWKFSHFSRISHSRLTCSFYHSCAVGRGKFNGFLHKIRSAPDPFCRLGCIHSPIEDLEHVFFHCTMNIEKIKKLKKKFEEKKIDYNLQNIFCENKIQFDVERFLYDFFAYLFL